MSDTIAQIRSVLPEAPAELADLYDYPPLPSYPDSRIQVLDLATATEYSKALTGWILPSALGLWALDDANDSNPFCFITQGPCKGAVLHLRHDDDSTVDFRSLGEFVAALHQTGKSHLDIDDMSKPERPEFNCASEIESLVAQGTEDGDEIACFFINCSSELPDQLVGDLAGNANFFIREAVARWLVRHPAGQHLSHAELLADDDYQQVAAPGRRASKAINRVIHG